MPLKIEFTLFAGETEQERYEMFRMIEKLSSSCSEDGADGTRQPETEKAALKKLSEGTKSSIVSWGDALAKLEASSEGPPLVDGTRPQEAEKSHSLEAVTTRTMPIKPEVFKKDVEVPLPARRGRPARKAVEDATTPEEKLEPLLPSPPLALQPDYVAPGEEQDSEDTLCDRIISEEGSLNSPFSDEWDDVFEQAMDFKEESTLEEVVKDQDSFLDSFSDIPIVEKLYNKYELATDEDNKNELTARCGKYGQGFIEKLRKKYDVKKLMELSKEQKCEILSSDDANPFSLVK